ncbi:MAG: SMC-Scp complex subunit ScpB, partial [Moraxellaceae bacterium]
MDAVLLKKILEGAIFAAGQPLSLEQLGLLFDEEGRPSNSDMRAVLDELKADYAEHGIELKEVASGFRFQVRQETGPWVSRLWDEKPSRYSRALLETLALIAYRQP